jgi:putative ABC transport system permease protein
MRNLLRRIWYIASGRRQELDLADELAFHREMKAQELRDRGVSAEDIAAETQRAMGSDLAERQRSRDVWIWPWLQDISQDVRFGLRMLAKDRRFTAAAVLALGLGIALNNSVFTIVNLAMFKDLPFEDAHRLVDVRLEDSRGLMGLVPAPDYRDWRDTARSFEGLAGHTAGTMNLSDDRRSAERLRGGYVSSNLLQLLRSTPVAGRAFVADDERPGAESVTMVSYEIWQSRYGGEPIIGHAVRVNGAPSTVIGIMPPGFAFPFMTQLWQPLPVAPGVTEARRDRRMLGVVGRLADGVELPAARAEMQTIAATIAEAHPDSHKDLRLSVMRLSDSVIYTRRDGNILGTLMGAVGIVLLIACANVASLLLARSTHRSREIAVRTSLGATRWRIIRQLLVECGLIALTASAVGAWLSIFGAREISRAFGVFEVGAPGGAVMPYWVDLSFNGIGWMFLGGVALFTSLAAGLVPAWHLSRTNVNDTLKDGGRSGSATLRARRMTGGLLVAQLALTVILLSAAAMLTRAYFDLYFKDLVIDTSGMVTARITLPPSKYPTRESQQQFFDRLDQRLTATPVFAASTLASETPFMPLGFVLSALEIEGHEAVRDSERPQAFAVTVGPRYFDTLGLALTRGRALAPADGLPAQEGAVVNERFAAKFFPVGEALGQRIRFTTPATKDAPWVTIIGVSRTLPTFVRAVDTEAAAYVPMRVEPRAHRTVSIIARAGAGAGPAVAVEALRKQVSAIDADLPVFAVQTLNEAAAMGRASSRMIGSWFVTIASIALVLAVVGLYALTAHGVAQRSHEIGVRMALGARPAQVIWLFVRRAVVQLTLGLSLGIVGALAVGGLPFIRDANPRDPLTLVLVSVLLVGVAMTASVWPARKAARVDPATALRAE